ncbi:3-hydroxybutyryl-CoA dehydrogenase [Acinetobacter sp. ANC 4558]|uniref:3-hydroxyacyl-CoA dehydrogenase n=1 Tax=Acinetobacter sp. ANC 4558 TaxID=1977876 RepID=UPI000A32DAAE|nr:3-hydroxyacyl-CoA dehydrogenase [Acinetobacter sp. ANC 4558]OTG82526.1 3-hydroxybutyryl-CoA dehydrogenase [Acinetobacter sp. ANC 4558]
MDFKNITVAGSGVLGYQIAFQTAFRGFNVTVYDINDEVLDKAKEKFSELSKAYKRDIHATDDQLENTFKNLSYESKLADAVKDADLVIEAIPENLEIKRAFYENLSQVAPEKTIFTTNSSTMLPSQFSEFTGRPEKFLALHFANQIWKFNTAEIMGHSSTDKAVFESVVEFAKAIGMLALPLHKEQPGYILNSLLVPFLMASLDLWSKQVADPEIVDKTWMKATGSPMGPFAILDIVGISTVYNIAKMNAEKTKDPALERVVLLLKTEFIDKGILGLQSGKGFYNYPNPAYHSENFLKSI